MIFGCIITLIFASISFGLNTGFIECFAIKNNVFCSAKSTSNDFITGEKMLVKMYAKMTVKVIVKHI
jgi:hypothetical protein